MSRYCESRHGYRCYDYKGPPELPGAMSRTGGDRYGQHRRNEPPPYEREREREREQYQNQHQHHHPHVHPHHGQMDIRDDRRRFDDREMDRAMDRAILPNAVIRDCGICYRPDCLGGDKCPRYDRSYAHEQYSRGTLTAHMRLEPGGGNRPVMPQEQATELARFVSHFGRDVEVDNRGVRIGKPMAGVGHMTVHWGERFPGGPTEINGIQYDHEYDAVDKQGTHLYRAHGIMEKEFGGPGYREPLFDGDNQQEGQLEFRGDRRRSPSPNRGFRQLEGPDPRSMSPPPHHHNRPSNGQPIQIDLHEHDPFSWSCLPCQTGHHPTDPRFQSLYGHLSRYHPGTPYFFSGTTRYKAASTPEQPHTANERINFPNHSIRIISYTSTRSGWICTACNHEEFGDYTLNRLTEHMSRRHPREIYYWDGYDPLICNPGALRPQPSRLPDGGPTILTMDHSEWRCLDCGWESKRDLTLQGFWWHMSVRHAGKRWRVEIGDGYGAVVGIEDKGNEWAGMYLGRGGGHWVPAPMR